MNLPASLGVVVIGRNEGDRLEACLESLSKAPLLIYVDSGSTDGSLQIAQKKGVAAKSLPSDTPFTAARARNSGIRRLISRQNDLEFIQTVDGDCTIAPEWFEIAVSFLRANPAVSTVFGRLRERNPDASVYNRVCDDEWNVRIGEAESCGGIALHRANALIATGSFDESLVAGEEPDLCLRLKNAGWSVWRIDAEMGTHDAAILRFGQWWRRSVRAGFAYAEHIWRHRSKSLSTWKAQVVRFTVWGIVWPIAIVSLLLAFAAFGWPLTWPLFLLFAYPLQFFRIWYRERERQALAMKLASLAVIGKFAEAHGALKFLSLALINRSSKIIEYK